MARLFLPRTSVGHVVVRPPYEHSPPGDPSATETRDTESVNVEPGNTGGDAARYREPPVTPPVDEGHSLNPPENTTGASVSETANEVNGEDSSTTPRSVETEEDEPRAERTRNNRRNKGRKNKKRKNKRKGGRKGRRGGGRRRQEEASSDSDPSVFALLIQDINAEINHWRNL